MKRLSTYQLENDLEFNCDDYTRRKAINTLSALKTREEQDEHILFLKGIGVLEDDCEDNAFTRNEGGLIL